MLATLSSMKRRPTVYAPKSGAMMLGVSTSNTRGETTAQSIASSEAAAGHQQMHRAYAGSSYTTFNNTQNIAGDYNTTTSAPIRTTHLSWNPLSASLTSENTSTAYASGFDPTLGFNAWKSGGYSGTVTGYGTETTKNITALRTIPDNHRVILTPWHEADGYASTNDYGTNYAQFRKAFQVIADIIHAFGNPTWQVCLLLTTAPCKNISSTNLPSNWWPASPITAPATGLNYVDVMGWDVYNEGSLDGSRWDSFSCSMGSPLDGAEAAAYQARYGGVAGWKVSDSGSGVTFAEGCLGWMNAVGITKYVIGETGTMLNHKALTPTWPSRYSMSTTKTDWIRSALYTLAERNANPLHTAMCLGVEYFMSPGRSYAGTGYLTNSLFNSTTGALITGITGTATTSSALPSGATTTDRYYVTDTGLIWSYATGSWASTGTTAIPESWQLWWNEAGNGWDGATDGFSSWKDSTTQYGADQVITAVVKATSTPAAANATMPTGNYTASDGTVFAPLWANDFNTAVAAGGDYAAAGYGTYFKGSDGDTTTSNGSGTYLPAEAMSITGGALHYNLHYDGSKYASAKAAPLSYQGYLFGSVETRMKVSASAGTNTKWKVAFLNWPTSNSWADGEIDWGEADGMYSQFRLASVHLGDDASFAPNPKQYAGTMADGNYHTIRMEWMPTYIKWYMDGTLISTVTDTSFIPQKAMTVFLQAEPAIGATPSTTETATVDVDWLVICQKQ